MPQIILGGQTVYHRTEGIIFADGTIQTTAAAGGIPASPWDVFGNGSIVLNSGGTSAAPVTVTSTNQSHLLLIPQGSSDGHLDVQDNGTVLLSANVNGSNAMDDLTKGTWRFYMDVEPVDADARWGIEYNPVANNPSYNPGHFFTVHGDGTIAMGDSDETMNGVVATISQVNGITLSAPNHIIVVQGSTFYGDGSVEISADAASIQLGGDFDSVAGCTFGFDTHDGEFDIGTTGTQGVVGTANSVIRTNGTASFANGGVQIDANGGLKLADYSTIASPMEGQVAYNYTNQTLTCYNGTAWAAVSAFPQVVWSQSFSGLTTPTSPNVPLTSYTIPTSGMYRISANIYPTTLNSGAWLVNVLTGFQQSGQAGSNLTAVSSCQLQAGNANTIPQPSVFSQFNAGVVVKFYTVGISGTESGGVYSVIALVERLG